MQEFLPGDFVSGKVVPAKRSDALHILVRDRRVAHSSQQGLFFDDGQLEAFSPTRSLYLGQLGVQPLFVSELPDAAELELQNLYSLLGQLTEAHFALAGRAVQISEWYLHHQFCGRCGAGNRVDDNERAMRCDNCNLLHYPRVSPCVIVLVTNGEQLLLARNAKFPHGLYSTLAGFIDPGESAETALQREVYEEVGLHIGTTYYFRSQPWPFPHQLMLGYFADYAGGAIKVDGVEIIEAQWWHYKNLPQTPPETSISGQLIRAYVRQLELN